MLEESIKLLWKVLEEGKANKERLNNQKQEFLKASSKAVRQTLFYIRENKRDTKTEAELSDLWAEVALVTQPFDPNLAERCYLKGNYWANPDIWSDEEIENAGIELNRIEQEVRDYFKGKAGTKKSQQKKSIDKPEKLPNDEILDFQNSSTESKKNSERWYQSRTIQASLIGIVGLAIVSCVGWYIQDNSDKATNIFAYVSNDGTVLRSKNFPWKITKTKMRNGNIIYIINERKGDPTAVEVFPDNTTEKYFVSDAWDGIKIEFTCPEEEISNFRVKLKY